MDFYLKENGMKAKLPYGEIDISGNEDYGYRPFQLMVASIAGCSASVFRKILEKQRTEVADLQVHAEVERNSEEANRIEKITLKYMVKGRRLDPERLYKNMEIARKNCSMIRSVEGSITIEEHIDTVELS
ncbi:osmotically inducible protein C [Oceanobacillus iheyensis]|nr:osmotically inducible protein C [Oceanobacillus iheyensis]NAO99556.1 OsmC family peroxiredoxin [Halomonas sp. MG34]